MARIFGIWNVDGRPVEPQLLARMGDTMAYPGSEEAECFVQGAAGMGCRLFRITPGSASETQPVVRHSGSSLVFDGRLDNRADLIVWLRTHQEVPAEASDPQLVAAAYDALGADCIAQLEGDFSLGLFDPGERRLLLARDAIGIRPLYYCETPHSIVFASEIKAILTHPDIAAHPNDRLLADFMLRRLHRRDHDGTTFFDGISGVPPSHVVVFTKGRTSVRRYWDFDGGPHSRGKSFEQCAEEFQHHFRRAVQRRMRSIEPVAVSVSGGLDSSSIFCMAETLTPNGAAPVLGFTYTSRDGSPADESHFVREIGRRSRRPIEHVTFPPPVFMHGLREVIRQVESPMLDVQHHRHQVFQETVRASGARTLLTGHWGDQILFDQAYLIDLLHRFSWLTIRTHLRNYPRWFADAEGGEFTRAFVSDLILHELPHWSRRVLRTARRLWKAPLPFEDWFSDRFKKQAGADVFDQDLSRSSSSTVLARDLYLGVRSRYHGLCLDWNNQVSSMHGLETAFPFLDRDLVDFVMGVPGELLTRNGEPKALLREALKGIVPDAILRRTDKADFTRIVNDASRQDYPQIAEILGPKALVVQLDYVDAGKLKSGLGAALARLEGSRSAVASWRLNGLLALELWLQEFAGRGHQKEDRWRSNARTTL